VTVGDGAQIGAQAGVHGNVPAGARILGSPAVAAPVALRAMAALPRLPDLLRAVRARERRVAELERRADG
jgi:UDP-3-O-[3-hydroxymyristoyl] glucosamine N-acyltransferase